MAKALRKRGIDCGRCRATLHTSAENLLDRKFDVSQHNRYWVSDITYIWTATVWLYLATVMDLYSRRIVGWSMGTSMTRLLVMDALLMAVWRRKTGKGLIHHSDRGSQYCSVISSLYSSSTALFVV